MSVLEVFQLVTLIAQLLSLAFLFWMLVRENRNVCRTTASLHDAFIELEKARELSRQLQARIRETGAMSPKSHGSGSPS